MSVLYKDPRWYENWQNRLLGLLFGIPSGALLYVLGGGC